MHFLKNIKLVFLLLVFLPKSTYALEALGGEITWKCAGGNNFVFELVLYRDCNSLDITSLSENIQVWNHATVTDISVNFISKTTISPSCSQNANSLPSLDCGLGDNAGNGLGAVQKIIYQSNSITLSGIPPAEAWIFTYKTSSRKASISNLVNPDLFGMTLVAKMFPISKVQNGCLDNSPQFLENPYLVVCSGTNYLYMPNVSDEDLDSLYFKLVNPLNDFSNGSFNPPTNPELATFSGGFSAISPTPGITINGSNTSFQQNPVNGDISFSSIIPGEYVFKFLVESFRNGIKIAEVEREMIVFVVDCNETNTEPTIIAPFQLGGTFQGNFTAGSLVSFTLNSADIEFLQDGFTAQENTATLSGKSIANITNTGIQGSSITVNWQTNCSDLKNNFGNEYLSVPYDFVIKVQDNYCQVPRTSYQRVTINLTTNVTLEPSQIQCIKTLPNGDLDITWSEVENPSNDFVQYELHSLEDGLLAVFPSISNVNAIIPAVNAEHAFYIKTISGTPCSIAASSDTVSNILLSLYNPLDGTVTLSWNEPFSALSPEFSNFYEIYREYPFGSNAWILIGKTDFGLNQFRDTIDICDAFLNYQVVFPSTICGFTSNTIGDNLEDKISPDIPVISSVSIDTLSGLTTIFWNQNLQTDTYGYIIYTLNSSGILIELDTVYGISNNSYSFMSSANISPKTFSIAAFDSCQTDLLPATYQTSAKGDLHTTMFLNAKYEICTKILTLNWTNYLGFDVIQEYEIYGHKIGETWSSYGTTSSLKFDIELEDYETYEFAILVKESGTLNTSFSNKISFYAVSSSKPNFNYTRVATVNNDLIEIKHYVETISGISELALERQNDLGVFEEISRQSLAQDITFFDNDVRVSDKSYSYQVRIIDSCGNASEASNQVKTILLKVKTDNLSKTNFLTWSAYDGFNGSILYYNVYRGFDGVFEGSPFKSVLSNQLFCEDTITVLDPEFNGRICYLVVAVESFNIFGFQEVSYSNKVCPVFEPIIYIPNTFTPNGDEYNQIFKPSVLLSNVNDYSFTIIDRWGQVIFRTNDVNEGWGGEISGTNNNPAKNGTFVYVVKLKDGNNQEIIRRGHVNLIGSIEK